MKLFIELSSCVLQPSGLRELSNSIALLRAMISAMEIKRGLLATICGKLYLGFGFSRYKDNIIFCGVERNRSTVLLSILRGFMENIVNYKAVFHTEYCIRMEVGVTSTKQFADDFLIARSFCDDVNMCSTHVMTGRPVKNQACWSVFWDRIRNRFHSPEMVPSIFGRTKAAAEIEVYLCGIGIFVHSVGGDLPYIEYGPLDRLSVDRKDPTRNASGDARIGLSADVATQFDPR